MKSSKVILALWLGASAWAQTLPQKQPINPPVQVTPHASPAKSAAAPRSKPLTTRGKHTKRQLSQTADRRHAKRKKVARLPSSATNAMAVNGKPAPNLTHGRRDPFVSPVVERVHNAATCNGTGRQCLAVGELSLHGVVHSPSGFIAVVMNGEHTYFLREHDPLADGAVERITKDTIILRERTSDSLGRPWTHEVTKKLGVPAV